jgi:F-type H+-transporting ATPase subunit delta
MRHSMPRRQVAGKGRPCYARGARSRQVRSEGIGLSGRAARPDPGSGRLFSESSWGETTHLATDDPMMASMAGRYAAALFELAREQKQLDQVERDVASFQSLLEGSPDLARLVRSPVIAAEAQARALEAILTRVGISGVTANFLRLIVRNRRLFAIADVLRVFQALLARERGEVSADVTSAHPLSQEQMQVLNDSLKASISKHVQIRTRVDPNLLGGLIVKVGSKMIDSSLRTKLNNLKVAMKGIG